MAQQSPRRYTHLTASRGFKADVPQEMAYNPDDNLYARGSKERKWLRNGSSPKSNNCNALSPSRQSLTGLPEYVLVRWPLKVTKAFSMSQMREFSLEWSPGRQSPLLTLPTHSCTYSAALSPHYPSIISSATSDSHIRVFDLRTPALASNHLVQLIPIHGSMIMTTMAMPAPTTSNNHPTHIMAVADLPSTKIHTSPSIHPRTSICQTATNLGIYSAGQAHAHGYSNGAENMKPRPMEVVPPKRQNSNTFTGKIKDLARDLVAETIGSLGKGGVAWSGWKTWSQGLPVRASLCLLVLKPGFVLGMQGSGFLNRQMLGVEKVNTNERKPFVSHY
ncbi:hypothetical protein L207DRAFT_563925 [Hyaloscypha variabilis F]|uniref:WD40 repeat-like protein n=1 Tax=Hyaloscypha variabilis (strain UAMH 11265 / GT02V1 / F) TaxID=1149755 RepID=A0A2J6RXE8_HYAVF|nr:hypothetical protein L207DRAFT_563925 [Hyaloscypha variabilis F]